MTEKTGGRDTEPSEASRAWGRDRRKVCRSPAVMRADAEALRLFVRRGTLISVTALDVLDLARRLEQEADRWEAERHERKARRERPRPNP